MREYKGSSIIAFPEKYTVIDLETTGLSPQFDEIIEFAAIKYRDGKQVDIFNTLVNPGFSLDPFITDLTGITDEMLKCAPTVQDVIEDFVSFIGDDCVIGHNVGFDVNFIYDTSMKYLGKPFRNDHINTVRFANKLLPDLPHKTLTCICEHFCVPTTGSHRALKDCELVNEAYQQMIAMIDDRDAFISLFKPKNGNSWKVNDVIADPNYVASEDTEIYGKVFCFTGKLDQMPRKDACQIVVNMGGSVTPSVTKETHYLVLGCTDYCKTIKDGKTQKQKKADKLQQNGYDIMVITEDVFYQMIEDY